MAAMTSRRDAAAPMPTEAPDLDDRPAAGDPALAGASTLGPPGHDGFAHLEIGLGLLPGQHRIAVNGQDVTRDTLRATVHAELAPGAATYPVLVLERRTGAAEISGPGVVHLVLDEEGAAQSVAEAVGDWLDNVDPHAIAQAVLANASMATDPISATIEELRRRARRG